MAVVAGAPAGGAHLRNVLALVDLVAHTDQNAAVVGVVGDKAVLVVDLHQIAEAAHPAGIDDLTAVRSHDVGAVGLGNINAAVEGGSAKDVPGAIPGGNGAAADGPAEGAGGRPAGALLGAPCLDLRDGLLENILRNNLALNLGHALIGDLGGGVGPAVLSLGDDLGVALPHGVVIPILDLVGDVLLIVLHLGGLDGQIGHGVADQQLVADLQPFDVKPGVQPQQVVAGHVVILGDN